MLNIFGDLNGDGRRDLAVSNYGSSNVGELMNTFPSTFTMNSRRGLPPDVEFLGFNAGQLVQRPGNTSDGLHRLQVSGSDYVPDVGNEDLVRTVDVFENPTGVPITTTVRIVGNLGSDAATTIFATSDGDTNVEKTDQWIGTDDADDAGTPAIIHYIHGPNGLQPTSIVRTGDNIEQGAAGNALTVDASDSWTTNATVSGRQIFYNHSYFNKNSAAANADDAAAIATDKQVLLPGGTATFANYTTYAEGINGLRIDAQHMPGTPTVDDFLFRMGITNTPYGKDLNSSADDWPSGHPRPLRSRCVRRTTRGRRRTMCSTWATPWVNRGMPPAMRWSM